MNTMLIRVEHATSYSYSEPLLASTQYLRMTPVSGRTQAVEAWKLTCPGAVTHEWQDQYGNVCHTLTIAEPVNQLAIKVSGIVRTRDTNGVVGLSPAELPPDLYLRETSYTVASPSIRDYAERFRANTKSDLIEALHEIMTAIADDVEYSKGDACAHDRRRGLGAGERRLPGSRAYFLRRLSRAWRSGPLCQRLPGARGRA
jgi:transglutaminase-like putative cysteine protease